MQEKSVPAQRLHQQPACTQGAADVPAAACLSSSGRQPTAGSPVRGTPVATSHFCASVQTSISIDKRQQHHCSNGRSSPPFARRNASQQAAGGQCHKQQSSSYNPKSSPRSNGVSPQQVGGASVQHRSNKPALYSAASHVQQQQLEQQSWHQQRSRSSSPTTAVVNPKLCSPRSALGHVQCRKPQDADTTQSHHEQLVTVINAAALPQQDLGQQAWQPAKLECVQCATANMGTGSIQQPVVQEQQCSGYAAAAAESGVLTVAGITCDTAAGEAAVSATGVHHTACASTAVLAAVGSSRSMASQPFRGSAALPAESSSEMDDGTSSDISSSISCTAPDVVDGSAQHICEGSEDCPGGTGMYSREEQPQQQQQVQPAGRSVSSSNSQIEKQQQIGDVCSTQQQQQQQEERYYQMPEQQQGQEQLQDCLPQPEAEQQRLQQQASAGSRSSRYRAAAAATMGRSISNDPDYEVPQGKLTETQVLMSHADKLHLDRYGFIVSEAEAHARAARLKRTPGQVKREQRHVAKWRHMLGTNREQFMAYAALRPNKVKRRVRKGIPDEFRGLVWQYLSGGRELMQQHPGDYAQLLTTSNEPVDLEIMRDLNRTFPNHVFFHQRQGPGQQSLFHVLRAYSAHDRQVGYVQGMGFVTAILLMYMSEEEAFWTLVALLKGASLHPPLEGMYQAGMPLLQQCLFQFQELLKQENPRLGGHLEQEGVVPSMYCTHWFNTIFAYSLPFEQLLRVWDVFLLEGLKVVFRVGVTLLSSSQDQLLGMPFEKLVACLNGRKFPVLDKHPDVLMKAALRIPVSKRLEALREKYQQQVAAAEASIAAACGSSKDGNTGHDVASVQYRVVPVAMGPSD